MVGNARLGQLHFCIMAIDVDVAQNCTRADKVLLRLTRVNTVLSCCALAELAGSSSVRFLIVGELVVPIGHLQSHTSRLAAG